LLRVSTLHAPVAALIDQWLSDSMRGVLPVNVSGIHWL
jgi:hypothetical protein